MSGISVLRTNVLQTPQNSGALPKVQRQPLLNIKNVNESNSVSFEPLKHVQSAMKSISTAKNTRTPSLRGLIAERSTVKTPGSVCKSLSKQFQIFDESVTKKKKIRTKPIHKHEELPEKEYMPPNTDQDFDLEPPLPDYLQTVKNFQPTFNVDLLKELPNIEEVHELINHECIDNTDILLPLHTFEEKSHNEESVSEEELLWQLEHQSSFSLEALDKELRAAGLEIPRW